MHEFRVMVVGSGDGPYVPTLAASALARKLAAGQLPAVGAMPCMGLLTLEDSSRRPMAWTSA